jgi:hypothetical protein
MIQSAPLGSSEIPTEINAACAEIAEKELNLLRNLRAGDFSEARCGAPHKSWIAGGALRAKVAKILGHDEGETDVDCYFSYNPKGSAEEVRGRIFAKQALKAEVAVENDDLLSISTRFGKIDLIRNNQGNSAARCLRRFDFTCCAIAIDTNNVVTWHTDALPAIKDRRIRMLNVTNGFSSLMRTQKYVRKGYAIDLEENEKLARVIVRQGAHGIKNKVTSLKTRGQFYKEYEQEASIFNHPL